MCIRDRFNSTLKAKGHQTHYLTLDDPHNTQNLVTNLKGLLKHYKATQFSYQQPDEYRLDQQLKQFCATLELPTQVVDTIQLISQNQFNVHSKRVFWFQSR